nr:DNA helicase [Tanacetum cinerariifolium]
MMVHGPCGPADPITTCMKENVCSKKFPKKFNNETFLIKMVMFTTVDEIQYPAVQKLSVHLENKQVITFRDRQPLQFINNNDEKKLRTLMEWLEFNKINEIGCHLRYINFLKEFVWYVDSKTWPSRRRKGHGSIGRLVYVHPNSGEIIYLRILLCHQKGCTSFEDIRTVNRRVYETFRAACDALGLLGDDKEWDTAMKEACFSSTASQLRSLTSQDLHILDLHINDPELEGSVLYELQTILHNYSKSVTDFGLPPLSKRLLQQLRNIETMEEKSYNQDELATEELIFLYGHGGTGKTFLRKTIINSLRSYGKIVLAFISFGIASLLLPVAGESTIYRSLDKAIPLKNDGGAVELLSQSRSTGNAIQENMGQADIAYFSSLLLDGSTYRISKFMCLPTKTLLSKSKEVLEIPKVSTSKNAQPIKRALFTDVPSGHKKKRKTEQSTTASVGNVMSSDSHATITYTSMSSYEVIVNGYYGMSMDPLDPYIQLVMEAPPSPEYIPGPEAPPSPDYIPGPEAPPSPDYIPAPKYPEYLPPADDVLLAKEQPQPAAEDGDDEKSEEDSIEYPTSRGDDDADDDGDDLLEDDADYEEEEESSDSEEEEEEHLAPTVLAPALYSSVSASEETEPFEEGETAATPPPFGYCIAARISIQPHILMPFRSESEVERLLAIPTPPLSSVSPTSYPLPPFLMPLPIFTPLPTSSFLLPLSLPSTSGSESIPEMDIPLRKRACFTTPTGGYEVGESSLVAAARQIRPALTTADRRRADDRLIGRLRRERRYFRTLSTTYAQEVAHSRDYCTQIMDYCQSREVHTCTLVTQIEALQRDVNTLQRHHIDEEDRLTRHIQHEYAQRDVAPEDGDSCS